MTAAAIASFVFAFVGTRFLVGYARRRGILDVPNDRSSHTVPTPRGGGAALVAGVIVGTAYQLADARHAASPLWLVGLATVSLALVGWLDDRHGLPIGPRLAVHALCGVTLAMLVDAVTAVPGALNAAWLLAWMFWTVASINIVNFMDGIDGLVASQGVVYGVFLAAIAQPGGAAAGFGFVLAAACAGFLVWNWSPAKIFMGDVGSGPLGFFLVAGGAQASTQVHALLILLPLFPLYFDAFATLVIRFRRGDRLTEAHRSHLYQRLANTGAGHAIVAGAYTLAAAVGATVAIALENRSLVVAAFGASAYASVMIAAWFAGHAAIGGTGEREKRSQLTA